jgi:glutamyl-tRNA synthetase
MAIGRFAPSPTGTLHLGNLRTAIAGWLFARSTGSDFLLRWEDLDSTASAEREDEQRHDLERLGLDFNGNELRQSERVDVYRDVIADLGEAGLTYSCWCSRREIREAASAPHGTPGNYPGTCRDLGAAALAAHRDSGRPPALRLRGEDREVTILDRLHGPLTRRVDDFVIARGDGTPAYNLVVVVDDAAQQVEEVVRGSDLYDSTPRHVHLQRLLSLPEPHWSHIPLVVDHHGDRLAKCGGSNGLDRWIEAGGTVGSLLGAAGRSLGIDVEDEATTEELLAGFDISRIPLEDAYVNREGTKLSLRH